MFEFITMTFVCSLIIDPKDDYGYAFIEYITIYENRIDSDDRKVELVSYYNDDLTEPTPWELDNTRTTQYQLTDNGMITFSVPYENQYEDSVNLDVEIIKGTVDYVINTETLKYRNDYTSEDDPETYTDYGYCINLNKISN